MNVKFRIYKQFVGLWFGLLCALTAWAGESFQLELLDVSPRLVRPAEQQQVKIKFRSPRDGQAMVRIFDRRSYRVRELVLEAIEANRINTVAWNGQDEQGEWVSDEAYYFTIEVIDIKGNRGVLDPTRHQAEGLTPMHAQFDREQQRLHFQLDEDGVVDIRAGIADGGPLMIKLLEWQPYLKGSYSIEWDGWDASRSVQVATQPDFHLFSQVALLPPNSIITKGHPKGNDQIYSLYQAADELHAKDQSSVQDRYQAQALSPPFKTLSPSFDFTFNEIQGVEQDLPVLAGKVGVTIRLAPAVKLAVTEQRYEILVFIDHQFVTEIEEGRSPARLLADTSALSAGRHVMTINVATLQGGLATLSKPFITVH